MYLLKRTLGRVSGRDPQALGVAVREAMETVNLCPDAIKRALMRQQVAAEAGVPEETLPEPSKPVKATGVLAAPARRTVSPPHRGGLAPSTAALDTDASLARTARSRLRRETRLVRYMMENPDWCRHIADVLPPDKLRDMALADLAALVRDDWDAGIPPVVANMRSRARHPNAGDRLADLAFPDAEPLSDKDLGQVLGLLLDEERREDVKVLQDELLRAQKAGDEDLALAIWTRLTQLKRARSL